MTGRLYDMSTTAICKDCGGDCKLSSERYYHGAKCNHCGSQRVKYLRPYLWERAELLKKPPEGKDG